MSWSPLNVHALAWLKSWLRSVRYVGQTWADKENTLHVPSYTLVDAVIG